MNEQYLNQTIRRIVYLESLKQSEINKLTPHIKAIDKLIKEQLLDDELTEMTIKSFNGVVTEIKQGVQAELIAYTDSVSVTLVEAATDTYVFEAKSIDAAFDGFKLASGIVVAEKAKILEKLVTKTPLAVKGSEGKTVTDLFNELANNESNKYINHIKLARYEGKTNQQIVQMIRGTRKNGYKDGLMEVTARQAKTIVRTTVQHAANQGKIEFANDNADIIKGEKWLSTLDGKTSCLVAGTLIDTPTGKKPIEQFVAGDLVMGGSGKVRTIEATKKSSSKRLCKVTLDNGEVVVCTADHKWWTGEEWVQAEHLKLYKSMPNVL